MTVKLPAKVAQLISGPCRGACAVLFAMTAILMSSSSQALATPCTYEGLEDVVGFQANTGSMWNAEEARYLCDPVKGFNSGLGTEPTRNVSITLAGNQPIDAFVANGSHGGELWIFYQAMNAGAGLGVGVREYTSPSITGYQDTGNDGDYQIAFQANGTNEGTLYTFSPATGAVNLGLGVEADTSPSDYDGNIAFVAGGVHSHELWAYWKGTAKALGYSVVAGSSPSLEGEVIAFDHGGSLWTYNIATGVAENHGFGIQTGTSPSIASFPELGGYVVAFQANGVHKGELWTFSPHVGGQGLSLGMYEGTSPSIAPRYPTSDTFEIAFEANTTALWTYDSKTGAKNNELGMYPGTSPSVSESYL